MIVAVLDNVRSALNVGSIFRSCDSFGVDRIVLCGISATPPSREIHKSALGAELSVPFSHYDLTVDAIVALRERGFTIIGVEQAACSVLLTQLDMDSSANYAFVFGNEVDGVSGTVLDLCDKVVEIEQRGVKKSLNVSVAAGVVLWHATNLAID